MEVVFPTLFQQQYSIFTTFNPEYVEMRIKLTKTYKYLAIETNYKPVFLQSLRKHSWETPPFSLTALIF